MANAVKGEVGFVAGEVSYTLVFDFNAICTLEDEFDTPASDIGKVLGGGRASHIRTLFRIGLARNHPELTEEEAGDIISEIGPPEAGRLITEAFQRAYPEAAKEGAARPRKAAARTS